MTQGSDCLWPPYPWALRKDPGKLGSPPGRPGEAGDSPRKAWGDWGLPQEGLGRLGIPQEGLEEPESGGWRKC